MIDSLFNCLFVCLSVLTKIEFNTKSTTIPSEVVFLYAKSGDLIIFLCLYIQI
jgi:hypothetical protein